MITQSEKIQILEERFEGETFLPTVWQGKVVENSFTGNKGTVIGARYFNTGPSGGSALKARVKAHGYPEVKVRLPLKTFPHYTPDRPGASTAGQWIRVHQLVANTHLPFFENCPDIWKSKAVIAGQSYALWDILPEYAKEELQKLYQVHHVDGNKENPNVENLQYVSPRDNSHAHHYGI